MFMKNLLKPTLPSLCLILCLCTLLIPASFAFESSTLYNGCRGDEVRELQQALIDLGFLNGTADGVFGNKTENAVRAFQKKNRLTVDGLAGSKTREMAVNRAAALKNPVAVSPAPQTTPAPVSPSGSQSPSSSVPSGSIFGGNYTTIRSGNRGVSYLLSEQHESDR